MQKKQLPFKNTYENRMREIIQNIKNEAHMVRAKWIHRDVLEDVKAAVYYSLKLKESMGEGLQEAILFGGVMRTPFESHAQSDVDLMIIFSSREGFTRPENGRISFLLYPDYFLSDRIGADTPESSFMRNVFLQAHAVLVGDADKAAELRAVAQENFKYMDVAQLVRHRIRKHKLDFEEKSVNFALEKLGVMPWVFSDPNVLKKIINAVAELEQLSAANIYG